MLSFIAPIVLYRNITKHNSVIEVREVSGRRRLYIGGYPQSQSSYRRDWRTILRKAGVDRLGQPDILVLGLGGGDVIKLLQKMIGGASITAVELEGAVIEVAKKYFGVLKSPKLKIVLADANKYLENNGVKYDLVVVDLYSGDDVSAFVTTTEFLKHVAKSLNSSGKVIINYASHGFTQKDFAEFESKLRDNYVSVTQLKTWGHTYYSVG